MPTRVYYCSKCRKTRSITFAAGAPPRCACGSQELKRVTLAPTTAPTGSSAAPAAQGPSIPAPPPLPTAKAAYTPHPKHAAFLAQQKNTKPSGLGLLAELQASKVGVLDPTTGARTVDRAVMDQRAYERYWAQADARLPTRDPHVVGTQAEVDDLVRCVIERVRTKSIADVWIDFLVRGRKYYLPQRVVVDLTLPLGEMLAGRCRPYEHGRSNTDFQNKQQDLPTRVAGEPVHYLEFGWRYNVPGSFISTSRDRNTGQVHRYMRVLNAAKQPVTNFAEQKAVYDAVAATNGSVDAGLRLVISDWGHLFFTSDHYRSFLIYRPAADDEGKQDGWVPYAERQDASASAYHRGEPSPDMMLPVSAPGYW